MDCPCISSYSYIVTSNTGRFGSATTSVSYVLLDASFRDTHVECSVHERNRRRNRQTSEPLTQTLELAHLLEKRHNPERLGDTHRPTDGSSDTGRLQYLLSRCPCIERLHCLAKDAVRAATTKRDTERDESLMLRRQGSVSVGCFLNTCHASHCVRQQRPHLSRARTRSRFKSSRLSLFTSSFYEFFARRLRLTSRRTR